MIDWPLLPSPAFPQPSSAADSPLKFSTVNLAYTQNVTLHSAPVALLAGQPGKVAFPLMALAHFTVTGGAVLTMPIVVEHDVLTGASIGNNALIAQFSLANATDEWQFNTENTFRKITVATYNVVGAGLRLACNVDGNFGANVPIAIRFSVGYVLL